jgi:hypothetical protein
MQPGAGGVSPRVGNIRRCGLETHIAGDMSRMQPGAGGVSPPWHRSAVTNRKRTSQAICRACNGGLTPAALVNMRAPQKASAPGRGTRSIRRCESETHTAGDMSRMQPRAGGSAPRGKHPPLRIGNAHRRRYVAHATRSGGASAPRGVQSALSERETRKVIAWQSQTRFGKPRRAHARRSCERAFVHCKRRYFSGQRTPCSAPRAGGVSPPWETSAVTNRKRTSQAMCRACNHERGASAPVARERSRPV